MPAEKGWVDDTIAHGENDHDLVYRVQRGDKGAYDLLMLRYQDIIGQQMRRFSRDLNTVEELTQTVFVRAYFSLDAYRPNSPFLHWLRTIASRVGYDHWREEKKNHRLVPLGENTDGAQIAVDSGEAGGDDIYRSVLAVMDQLNPTERQVLYRIYVDGLSVAEVAEEMGWGKAVTKMRSLRARRKLRSILRKSGGM